MSIKLHLGCGSRYLPGYTHIDIEEFPHIDYLQDVRKLPMFVNNSVDEIYAAHLLEHFYKEEAVKVLTEWYRVLRSPGLIRLSVPSLDALVNVYTKTHDVDLIVGSIYGHGKGNRLQKVPHRYIYNFTTLKTQLEKAGFCDVKLWDWKECLPADFDDYSKAYIPHMDFDNGILVSLNIEGRKVT